MKFKRRKFLMGLSILAPTVFPPFNKLLAQNMFLEAPRKNSFKKSFKNMNDRVWIGKDFWSVPMEDWEIKNDRLEFSGIEKNSRLHLLTHVLKKEDGDFKLKTELGLFKNKDNRGSAGFTIGIKDFTDPESVKAACYFGQGISAGVCLDGTLFIADKKVSLPASFNFQKFTLQLNAKTLEGKTEITLLATDLHKQNKKITNSHSGELDGLVALENNMRQENESTFWWNSIELDGNKIQHQPGNSFGPVLWSMYTLSKGKVKLTAQLPPVGLKDPKKVELHILKDGKWKKEKEEELDPRSFTSIFVLDNWVGAADASYRLQYKIDGEIHYYEGVIRREPSNKTLKFGGLTCQHGSGFPYRPLVENLGKMNPDILFFSGDQIYEENGGYPIKRQPGEKAILSYLGKWCMFGWAFGNVMRDRPTICTPDDHDVFQGNLWGEGGTGISFEEWEKVKDAHGGFVQTPKMVNVVNRTQCGHLPDAYHQQPLPSGITTWFTQLNYGRISFAIISDRLFKSGPEMVRAGEGRIDHIKERAKPGTLESKELSFIGKQQLKFLNDWIVDWKDIDMKVLLSQTLFSNTGTHHGPQKEFLYGDMDSGGWPKAQRDEVIKTIRKAAAFHINGDQHLPFLVQYSVDEPRDGGWTFCTPAISTGYPRWGQPDLVNIPFTDRPNHNLPNTGCYRDIFGNDNYIYAVGNPEDNYQNNNRYITSQKKASGFGLVTFDTSERTIKMEASRFLANLEFSSAENTYPGWPLAISQFDNDGRKPFGYLPKIRINQDNQVVKIINENTNEIVTAIRIKGNQFIPPVFEIAKYTLLVGEGQNEKVLKGIEISDNPDEELVV